MVSEAVVLETVRRMKASGLGESVIVETLKDIGISEEEARRYLAREAAPPAPQPPPSAPVAAQPEPVAREAPASKPAGPPESAPQAALPQPARGEEGAEGGEEGVVAVDTSGAGEEALTDAGELDTSDEAAALAERTTQKVREHLEEHLEAQAALHAATQASVEQAAAAVEEHARKLGEVSQKLDAVAGAPPAGGDKALAAVLRELRDLKAMTAATRDVLEKVLEVNRRILNRLD